MLNWMSAVSGAVSNLPSAPTKMVLGNGLSVLLCALERALKTFTLAKSTDAAWWFYLFWGGKFLYDRFGLNLKGLALPLIIIYVVSDAGSIAGGWLSSSFIKRGWSVN